jgi:molybdopterin converting factor small subunit
VPAWMKRITVHLHASLRRKRAGRESTGPLTTEADTVGELLDELDISEAEAAMIFVNGERRAFETAIQDGDEIRVFPLVGGG